MANIINQFVTSFSKLYIRSGKFTDLDGNVGADFTVGSGAAPTAAAVRGWFTDGVAAVAFTGKKGTLTHTGSAGSSAADITLTYTAAGGSAVVALATIAASATDAAMGASIKAAVDSFDGLSASVSGKVITVTGEEDAGDFTLTRTAGAVNGITLGALTETVAFVAHVDGTGTRQIPLVMEIGSLSNEATVIDTPTFGDKFKGKLRGQLDGGQIDCQLYWAPREEMHEAIRTFAQDGTAVSVGIAWHADASAQADVEYVVFNSFVSSFGIDTTFDDVAKVTATMVVDGEEFFAGRAGTAL